MINSINLTKKSSITSNTTGNSDNRQPSFHLTLITGFLLGFLTAIILKSLFEKNYPPIELPEKYYLITKEDTLRGYFQQGTLVIEFNNTQNK